MIDFQQKRQVKKVIYSKVFLVILFISVIFLGRATYNIYNKSKLSSKSYNETKKDYESLKARKDMLDSEINRLKTDSGMEEEIRSKFNVAKPGETVVVVIDGSSSTSTNANNSKGGFWSSFWSIFK
jgi:cell division protein FtsB